MYLQANPAKGRSQQEKDEAKESYTSGEQVLPRIARVRKTSAEEEDRRMIEEVRQMSLREVGVGSSESQGRSPRHRDSGGGHRESRAEESRRQRRRDHDRRRRDDASAASNQATSSSSHGTVDPRIRARQLEHQSSLRSLISSSDFDSSEIDEEVLRQVIDEILQDGLDLDNLNAVQEDELTDRIANALRQGRRPGSEDTHPPQSRESNHNTTRRRERDLVHRRRNEISPSTVDQTGQSSRPPVSRPHLSNAYPVSHGGRRRTSSDHRRQTSPAIVTTSSGRSPEARRSATSTATPPSNPTRTSSYERRHSPSSRRGGLATASSEAHRQATRSSTDLSNPSPSSRPERTHSLDRTDRRRNLLNQGRHGEEDNDAVGIRNQSPETSNVGIDLVTDSNPRNTNLPPILVDSATATRAPSTPPHIHAIAITDTDRQRPPYPSSEDQNVAQITSSSTGIVSVEPPGEAELLISCSRCNKSHLEQEVHLNCPLCLLGRFNLCMRCYLRGLGCLHWFGFGHAAAERYERQTPPNANSANHIPPHVLVGHRYILTHLEGTGAVGGESSCQAATANNRILQSGVFCSKCAEFADQCYWKCDSCNEGEWGFCNRCVNQGKCCSHPLLPIAHISTQSSRDSASPAQHTQFSFKAIPNIDSTSKIQHRNAFPLGSYVPLTFSRKCHVCKYPIPPSNTHFHCPQCNDGDYDICTACYLNLTLNSQISQENGPKGWRRCLNSHRMIVVGFEDSLAGQRRVIVNDLVGGHALKDDIPGSDLPDQPRAKEEEFTWRDGQLVQVHTIARQNFPTSTQTSKKFPPDGGFGMRTRARWSYWPEAGSADELEFPKGAIVSEVENINGDWFWGVYAGSKGLFPGNHVRILEDRSA